MAMPKASKAVPVEKGQFRKYRHGGWEVVEVFMVERTMDGKGGKEKAHITNTLTGKSEEVFTAELGAVLSKDRADHMNERRYPNWVSGTAATSAGAPI